MLSSYCMLLLVYNDLRVCLFQDPRQGGEADMRKVAQKLHGAWGGGGAE